MLCTTKHILTIVTTLSLALTLIGCAHTEKYLHPEKTFSENSYDISVDQTAQQLSDGNGSSRLPFYEVCADKASIHSPVIWVPLIGPAIDMSMSAKAIGTTSSRWDNAIIFLPIIGPAASFSFLSPEICTYKTIKQSQTGTIATDTPVTTNELQYITRLADRNCNTFLDRLSSSKDGLDFGKSALTDISSAVSAGTAFVTPVGTAVITTASLLTNKGAENLAHTYFGGQLIPAIKNKITADRETFKKINIEGKNIPPTPPVPPPHTIAEVLKVIDDYDNTCSVQNAIDSLNQKTN
ncbi:MAG: hypothetical protein EPN17_11015 [Methylobacter sp.]|nr:MAG: hypothetical protein EPN17_11015 [Methylobacter sp.]